MDASDPHDVVRATVERADAAFGPRLVAAFAIGSLAHGGFAPAVSDVDVALVLADPLDPLDAVACDEVADGIRPAGGLAARLSLFWSTLELLRTGSPGGRFPSLDRLDLAVHGRPLAGWFDTSAIPLPSRATLVEEGVRFALDKLAGPDAVAEIRDPAALAACGARHVTKRVLFPVRFSYTAATGAIGRNEDAIAWWLDAARPGGPLVAAAGRWRGGSYDAAHAFPLLAAELIDIYATFLAEHERLMVERQHDDLAATLRAWLAALTA